MRGAGTDWAGIVEAAMILQFYSLCQQAAADFWKNRLGVRIQRHRTQACSVRRWRSTRARTDVTGRIGNYPDMWTIEDRRLYDKRVTQASRLLSVCDPSPAGSLPHVFV